MKRVLVIIDGLGDEPLDELEGKTPLEAAFIPNIHYIANRGRIGRIATAFPGLPVESLVCIMGLLGYDPDRYYPCGRASFEALAKGIPLADGDLVLRCNCITVDQEKDIVRDFTAGMISDSDARKVISQIALPHQNWELFPGQSYRNTLIIRNAGIDVSTLRCFAPHMHIGEAIQGILPTSSTPATQRLAHEIADFLLATRQQIATMELPTACMANMLWVWSASSKPVWPSFKERTGLNGAFVGGLDFLQGIAMAAKIHFDIIPGATGYVDTDYAAKAACTIAYLQEYDFVLTHVNATDEEAHMHNYLGKMDAIEKVDRLIVGPVLQALEKQYGDDFRIVICGDHTTRCSDGKHVGDPVPYALYGTGIVPGHARQFAEKYCCQHQAEPSLSFLQALL